MHFWGYSRPCYFTLQPSWDVLHPVSFCTWNNFPTDGWHTEAAANFPFQDVLEKFFFFSLTRNCEDKIHRMTCAETCVCWNKGKESTCYPVNQFSSLKSCFIWPSWKPVNTHIPAGYNTDCKYTQQTINSSPVAFCLWKRTFLTECQSL